MGRKPCWEHRAWEDTLVVTATPRGTGVMSERSGRSVLSFVMHTLAPVSAMDECCCIVWAKVDEHEVGVSLEMVVGRMKSVSSGGHGSSGVKGGSRAS